MIDYDRSGEIGYKEFCLLNTDKRNIFAHIEDIKERVQAKEALAKKEKLKGKFGHILNLRKSVDQSSRAGPLSDDTLSIGTRSQRDRQSFDSSSMKDSDIYQQIRKKQVDKPKPYAVAEDINEEEPRDIPKKNDINRF